MAHVVSNIVNVVDVEKRSLVPSRWENSVRRIGMAESSQVGLSLAHAFAADALSLYLLGDDDPNKYSDESRWKLHVRLMTYLAASHCYSGAVTTIGPDYDAVALWCLPGQHLDGWWTLFRSGMWRLYYQLSPEGRRRVFDDVFPLLHDTMEEVMDDREFYYLAYIGTKPNARGKGYAKKLIEDMNEKADASNHPIYLEATTPGNVKYYERFGFVFKREINLKRGPIPIPLYVMVREPQSDNATVSSVSLDEVETAKV
ncbi:putative N-acetyltransferase [Cladobotryum mycophilum]|uniref:N-acetyltransferase n=1 Tax=Cladobotryum mycophilum TaxID=491253 RepID=A0ABR0T361_9HYPO